MISSVWKKLLPMCMVVLLAFLGFAGICSAESAPEMVTIQSVDVGASTVVLRTNSSKISFDSYKLGAPSRLVIDVMGALPEFSERAFAVDDGFNGVRVGIYADKTRFVFDSADNILPEPRIEQQGNNLVVQWGVATAAPAVEKSAVISTGKPVSVESINFDAANGTSTFQVKLSATAKVIPAKVDGDIIRFGVKNAVIPRALRRVVDASVFPSAVLQIVPYSTIIAGERCVMFAATMKGPVDFSLVDNGLALIFRSVDGPFAEVAPPALSTVSIPIDTSAAVSDTVAEDQVAQVISALSDSEDASEIDSGDEVAKVYTGEPVSLVFDDVDIRKVMQLIAEISDQNLILSDNVTGNISLRLHDVPWDQALDLVLEVKELGTIKQGNVVRVLPLKQIEDMKTARLQATKKIKTLEETQTQIFEVNYKDTDTIEDVIDDMISDQGEVSAIDGSKKIMVSDIPSKLIEVGDLLRQLDEPVKQVMIEARIVESNTSTGMDLGINWGYSYANDGTGSIGTDRIDTSSVALGGSFTLPSTLGTSGLGAAMSFGRLGYDNHVLDLKISALEASGSGRVISSPKVLTLDGESAKIEQGTSIPYQSVSDSGTTTEFQDATLALEVTPEVNPDGTVILEIKASNSTIGSTVSTGAGSAPSIDTKEAETKLMLKDGETTVIGGIYVDNTLESNSGTPFLKNIPFLGKLFESNSTSNTRSELLIFITPHIIPQ